MLLNHSWLKQQRAKLARRLNKVNPTCLGNHASFIGRAQVAQDTAANIETLADVKGEGALAFKDIYTRAIRQRS